MELADVLDSKSSVRKDVRVQLPPSAPIIKACPLFPEGRLFSGLALASVRWGRFTIYHFPGYGVSEYPTFPALQTSVKILTCTDSLLGNDLR